MQLNLAELTPHCKSLQLRLVLQGQGMTTGIAGAELLCTAIDARLDAAGNSQQEQREAIKGMSAAFQAQLGSFLDFPWSISSGIDAA